MKSKEILNEILSQLRYEDIKNQEGLVYLYECGGKGELGMETVRRHLRHGYKNTYQLSLPPIRDLQGFIIRKYIEIGHDAGFINNFAMELGLNANYFRSNLRRKKKERRQQQLENQTRCF